MVDNEGGDNEVMPSWRASQSVISREDSKGLLISRWRYQVSASRLPLWASRSEYGTASEGRYVRNSAVYLLASLSQRTIQLTFERFRLHCLRLRDMPKGMPRLIGLNILAKTLQVACLRAEPKILVISIQRRLPGRVQRVNSLKS